MKKEIPNAQIYRRKKKSMACEDMHKIPATELFMHAIRFIVMRMFIGVFFLFLPLSLSLFYFSMSILASK